MIHFAVDLLSLLFRIFRARFTFWGNLFSTSLRRTAISEEFLYTCFMFDRADLPNFAYNRREAEEACLSCCRPSASLPCHTCLDTCSYPPTCPFLPCCRPMPTLPCHPSDAPLSLLPPFPVAISCLSGFCNRFSFLLCLSLSLFLFLFPTTPSYLPSLSYLLTGNHSFFLLSLPLSAILLFPFPTFPLFPSRFSFPFSNQQPFLLPLSFSHPFLPLGSTHEGTISWT